MRDYFRVRLGRKNMSLAFQVIAELAEVLDDTIMYHRYTLMAICMRMGIFFINAAVSRPSCMRYGRIPGEFTQPVFFFYFSDFADVFFKPDAGRVYTGHSS
jgi:hypothetical protein